MCVSSAATQSQLVVAEVFEIVVGAARFVAGHAAEAAVDRLKLEATASGSDLCNDVAADELGRAGALMESINCVEDRLSAARSVIDDLGL
jgi:hypothetical protein